MAAGSTTLDRGLAEELASQVRPKRTLAQNLKRFVRRKPLGAISGAVLILLILTAIFAPVIATHDPILQSGPERLQAPSSDHWMGTDNLGRHLPGRPSLHP